MTLSAIRNKIKQNYATARGRNIATFAIFLLIAAVFWFLTALNDEVQRSYEIPIVLENVPEGITLLNNAPLKANVVVKNRGRSLIQFDWGKKPTININFDDFNHSSQSRVVISEQRLGSMVRNIFGNETDLISLRPDSINLYYTSRPGERLPIHVNIDAQTDPQYIIYGNMQYSADSATVYSVHGLSSKILTLNTHKISLRNLSDSTTIDVPLEIPAGTRVEPSVIKVTIPVQPLVMKKRMLSIKTLNVPAGRRMITFPSSVEISYLIPQNFYKEPTSNISATVNFRDIEAGSEQIPVSIKNIPDFYRGLAAKPDKVEFLIEH